MPIGKLRPPEPVIGQSRLTLFIPPMFSRPTSPPRRRTSIASRSDACQGTHDTCVRPPRATTASQSRTASVRLRSPEHPHARYNLALGRIVSGQFNDEDVEIVRGT